MATIEYESWIDVELDEVWAFHSTYDGLAAITPDWMGLQLVSIRGQDGEENSEQFTKGTVLQLAVQPFSKGPTIQWTSRITMFDTYNGAAVFRDRMVSGPFDEWIHTHRFFAKNGGTVMNDHVEYSPPIFKTVAPLSTFSLEIVFRYRHRKTRQLLENKQN